jgi:hypothetical protein
MFLQIRCLNAVIFSYFTGEEGKRYDLVVDRNVELFFLFIVVVVGEEGVLDVPLNRYLLLRHHYQVGLEHTELVLRYLPQRQVLVLGLHDVAVAQLLVNHSGGFVHQFQVVVFVCNHNSVEIGENLKRCDGFACWKSPYL